MASVKLDSVDSFKGASRDLFQTWVSLLLNITRTIVAAEKRMHGGEDQCSPALSYLQCRSLAHLGSFRVIQSHSCW